MYWLPLAFLSAFSLSTADALSKRVLRSADERVPRAADDFVIAWVREGYALPFLLLALFFMPVPSLDGTFWLTVVFLLPLEITALILYVKAIRLSPLSLTIPFMAFSPVFIIFIAFLILGEWPDRSGMAGILLIAAGAYLLNASASRYGPLGPIKAIFKEPGSVLMIVVALIYSITSTLGKVAVQHSNPVFFGFFYPLVLTIPLTIVVVLKGKLTEVVSRPSAFVPIGLCTAVMIITHFIAISLTDVAYMISIKRTSLIFSVLYGKFLFKEEKIKERLLGSVVMMAGVASIILL
jgi:drug/metabolite transporter (DMT)-like permease